MVLCVATLALASRDPLPRYRPLDANYRFVWSEDEAAVGAAAPTTGDAALHPNVANLLQLPDPVSALYREDISHAAVVEFFTQVAGNRAIAEAILFHAARRRVPIALVFAIVHTESRFDPTAVNANPTSVDRGLMQLNSRTFRELTSADFFDPDTNVFHGVDFLVWCLKHNDTVMNAVATYNAGLTRVRAGRIPASTRVYMRRVRTFQRATTARFKRSIAREFPGSSD